MLIKLYAFHCGFERFPNSIFEPFSPRPGELREIPYFFYMLEHTKGRVLFDAGVHPDLIHNIKDYLGPEADNWGIDVTPEDDARNKLATIGVKPEDIDHIVVSHFHYDHSGGITQFPNALCWIQQSEWEFANNPPIYQKGIYVRSEMAVPDERLRLIEGEHDLFGDGTVMLIPTPGHTKGHQAMLIRGRQNNYLLTADAAYSPPDLDDIARLPAGALVWSSDAMVESHRLLQRLRDEYNATVLCTHDTSFRKSIRLAPAAYYE